jgi:hypothetical protein
MAANPQRYEMHGIAMTEEAFERLISVESPYRKEYFSSREYQCYFTHTGMIALLCNLCNLKTML